MFRSVVIFSLFLCLFGCKNDNSTATVQQTSLKKPIVAIVPVIDHSHNDLTWSLSEELTRSMREHLTKQGALYLIGEEKVSAVLKKLGAGHDPFATNIAWVQRAFAQYEFVVFSELVEHDEVPLYASNQSTPSESPAELHMTVRLRVVDLRGYEPKIVLQELVHNTHHIPRPFVKANFYQVPWGNETFEVSPLGIAHTELSKEISSRIEDYILLAGRP